MDRNTSQTQIRTEAPRDKEDKYLTFALANEEYGLEILKVREIIGYIDVTRCPRRPPMSRA